MKNWKWWQTRSGNNANVWLHFKRKPFYNKSYKYFDHIDINISHYSLTSLHTVCAFHHPWLHQTSNSYLSSVSDGIACLFSPTIFCWVLPLLQIICPCRHSTVIFLSFWDHTTFHHTHPFITLCLIYLQWRSCSIGPSGGETLWHLLYLLIF